MEGHANLPVPLSIVHSFQRMRHFQPFSAIVAALRDSKILNLVDNDSCVQRKVPLREGLRDKPMDEIQKVYEDEAMARSVYAKGFGEEVPSTQFDIEAFFADYGPTNSVRLRRTHQKSFKGSVFVEFDSEETQKTFLALKPKPKWKGGDLVIKSKKQYCDDKVDDIREGRIPPNQRGGKMFKPRGDRRGGGNTNGGDDRDWRSRREDDRKGGFNDKNGGRQHRGFGRSGRGGGRGGGKGRGGRDRDGRDDEHKFEQRPKERDEQYVLHSYSSHSPIRNPPGSFFSFSNIPLAKFPKLELRSPPPPKHLSLQSPLLPNLHPLSKPPLPNNLLSQPLQASPLPTPKSRTPSILKPPLP